MLLMLLQVLGQDKKSTVVTFNTAQLLLDVQRFGSGLVERVIVGHANYAAYLKTL